MAKAKRRKPRVRRPAIHLVRRLQIWPVEKLKPYAGNSRTHSEGQVEEIGESFEEFGMNNPILVHKKIGIVAGEGRYRAAVVKGLTHLPVISLDHLSEMKARAYLIADNKLAEKAGWDRDILSRELRALEDLKSVPLPKLGFSQWELDQLLPKGEIRKEPDGPEPARVQKLKKTMRCPGCQLEFTTA